MSEEERDVSHAVCASHELMLGQLPNPDFVVVGMSKYFDLTVDIPQGEG